MIQKTLIVIHSSNVSYQETIDWCQTNQNNSSYHYVIKKSGDITKLTSVDRICKAVGVSSFKNKSIKNSVDPFSIHICLIEELNQKQYYSLAYLINLHCIYNVVTHKELGSVDPTNFEYEKLYFELNKFSFNINKND